MPLSYINNADDELDGTWTIYVHDNRANGRSYEQDPVVFVFVPKSNTNVVSGMFMGDGAISMYSGNAPAFTVTWRTDIANGTYELKIPGRSPADGVLIISAAGGDANNGDNIVTYQPNAAGDGWIIQTRDLPNAGLQSMPAQRTRVLVRVHSRRKAGRHGHAKQEPADNRERWHRPVYSHRQRLSQAHRRCDH